MFKKKKKLRFYNVKSDKKRIYVYKTHVEIYPYALGECKELEENNCIKEFLHINGYQIPKLTPVFSYSKLKRALIIPRGLVSISSLEELFNVKANYSNKSFSYDRVKIQLLNPPRNERQVDVLQFLTDDGSYSGNKFYGRKLLELDTGEGKTYCAISSICKLGVKAVILVDKIDLAKQWLGAIYKFTNLMEEEIFIVSGAKNVEKILKGKCKRHKIFIASQQTISSYAKKHGGYAITRIFKEMGVYVKIYDEAHKAMKSTINIDLWSYVNQTWYLTATALRSSKDENYVYKKIYGPIPSYVYHRDKADAYIKSIVLCTDSKATQTDQQLMCTFKGMSNAKYMEYLAFNKKSRPLFLKAISIFLDSAEHAKEYGKKVIIVGKRDVARDLFTILQEKVPRYRNNIGLYTSDVNKKIKHKQLDKDIIITTYKSFGEALDVPELRYVLMCEATSSEVIIKQVMGRLRDIGGNTFFFMLIDKSIKRRVNQYNETLPFMLERSVSCKSYDVK